MPFLCKTDHGPHEVFSPTITYGLGSQTLMWPLSGPQHCCLGASVAYMEKINLLPSCHSLLDWSSFFRISPYLVEFIWPTVFTSLPGHGLPQKCLCSWWLMVHHGHKLGTKCRHICLQYKKRKKKHPWVKGKPCYLWWENDTKRKNVWISHFWETIWELRHESASFDFLVWFWFIHIVLSDWEEQAHDQMVLSGRTVAG